MPGARPIIGIPADRRLLGPHPFHMAGEKYVFAIAQAAEAIPLVIPVLPEPLDIGHVLAVVDGLLFTGSPSNVEPARYGGEPSAPGTLHDPERDATTLPLIPAAVAAGVPVLGLCRGFQEMNVAYGGTLWQRVHEVPGMLDHRENKDAPLDRQYAPAHEVRLEPSGVLRGLAGQETIRVNSLHSQGVRDLAPNLLVEARASDGLIEGFRVAGAPAFALAVQWHPEWRVLADPFSTALFAAFGQAARARAARRSA
ncbi:MAG: gamma-glutamyl-gamma-aminobutyrate hydrolase family protein [Steroidobacteraceae bacterium]|nr:gamma-glutamyl-gamma-aminobutyrate hydrolase family protein [Steroidobacteraceae bacterium]MDW8258620.1 gamma-glutamyl-gamma-aminobutyrate hydrolase family protein [Gammaproteobacteria bacterium]